MINPMKKTGHLQHPPPWPAGTHDGRAIKLKSYVSCTNFLGTLYHHFYRLFAPFKCGNYTHTQNQQLQQQHSVLMMKSKRVLTLGGPPLVCVFYPGSL